MKAHEELTGLARREKIFELIQKDGSATVKALTELFAVSDMTIRRDLHVIEEQGIVSLHYGGASLHQAHPFFQDFDLRKEDSFQDKLAIARRAASYIHEDEVVYLDTSTSVLLMLRFLPGLRFTVVTNSMPIMEQVYRNRNIKLFMAPGGYSETYGGAMDYQTAEYLTNFHYDLAFLGSSTIDARYGVFAPQEIESSIKKCVMRCSDRTCLLVDHTKFPKKAMTKIGDIDDFNVILTDEATPEEQKTLIRQSRAELVVCE